jgi:glycosyltransferase involved in cell wall biosynthesis
MKILLLSHQFFPDIGGIEINSEILSRSFSEMNHEIHLITWTKYDRADTFPFKVIRNPSLKALFTEHSWADVIFENNPCLRLAWPNLFFRKPSIVALNTWVSRVDGRIGVQDKLKLLWLKRADQVIAVSNSIRDACFNQAIVIGNPYQAENFKILKGITRNKDFVFLGRLVSDKGADLAIMALDQLIRNSEVINPSPPYSLTIIGDGPELGNLHELTKKLGVAESVTFKGSVTGAELTRCLNEHKFLLVPSMWKEPFGNVALEGLACGCIPIVSDGGGLPDAVGMAGLVFERGNVDSLVFTMKKILKSSNLQFRLQFNAKTHLKNHLPYVVSQKYLDIIAAAHELGANKVPQTIYL